MKAQADIAAVARHRIAVDGDGVNTLVVFMSCPLRCKYCLNPQTLDAGLPHRTLTPDELYEETRKDELYFLATGGGVTFGGGEPLLRPDFIRAFRSLCGDEWKLNVETSLNVPEDNVRGLMPVIDYWFIDIKDMDPEIYRKYTGKDNERVRENLRLLADSGFAAKCTIRIPHIPGYNEDADRGRSIKELEAMGFSDFDRFEYKTDIDGKRKRNMPDPQGDKKADSQGE
ncbi:MAG: radical SAM protein [Bacteroidales bacterium]|nr:radical SAM protein [Bacteroidales bacterium]